MGRSHLVARNVLAMVITQLLSWVATTALMLYVPRYVGDVGLGRITLAFSFMALASTLVSLGSSTVIVTEVAKGRRPAADYLVASLFMRLPLSLLAVALCTAVARLLHYPAQTQLFIAIASGGLALTSLADATGSVLRGQERISLQSMADLAGKVVTVLLTIALIGAHAPIWTLVAVGSLSALSSLLVNLAALRGLPWPRPGAAHWQLARHLIVAGLPYVTTTLFLTIYGQTGPLVLHQFSGDAAVGWYGLARRISGTAMFIPTILTGAMLPTLIRLRHENPAAFPPAVRRMVNLMLLCVAPLAVGLICLPGKIILLLHYPAGYLHAIPIFVVSGVGLIIWFVTQALGTAMIANEQQQQLSRAAVGAVLLTVPCSLLGVWLTQRLLHNGAIGAAIADNLTECYMLGFYLRVLSVPVFSWESLRYMGKVALAALPMGLLVLFNARHALLALSAGIVIYAGLCYVFRCISAQDLGVLRAMVARRTAAAQ